MHAAMKLLRRLSGYVFAVLAGTAISGCTPPALHADGEPGRHLEILPLTTYGTVQSRGLLWLAGVKGIGVSNSIDCYRIVYASVDEKGKPIRLSGMLALPHALTPRGLVGFQHGTTPDRESVPSNLSTDGLAAAILFAGNGYAVIAPDYAGLGISRLPHPYYVATDTARAVVDMIHSVRHIRGVPSSAPFLVGFSEGGYASLAAQRALEAAGESNSVVVNRLQTKLFARPHHLRSEAE
jgi:Secretory lipase